MLIIINPNAGGGRAMERWESVRRAAGLAGGEHTEYFFPSLPGLPGLSGLDNAVSEAYRRGERQFVAAGGDGTVNALLNALMKRREAGEFGGATLGAIGLGSSNDFHKGAEAALRTKSPARINFNRVRPQDVGRIDAVSPGGVVRRYFIVNASAGVTAEGNAIFNAGAGFVASLKRIGPGAAIPAAALLAIRRHRNFPAALSVDGGPERRVLLSNLSIFKNPNISGPMRIAACVAPNDGRLGVWLEENRSRSALAGIFLALVAGRFSPNGSSTVRCCRTVRVGGTGPFAVEYDGEILSTTEATFSVAQNAMEVCQ